MPRRPRRFQLAENICYHVINRGHNREVVFRDDLDRQAFLTRLADVHPLFEEWAKTVTRRQKLWRTFLLGDVHES